MRPLISVIIPCYNDGKYLEETLQKLNEQSFKNFETIIVNDGSTDPATIKVLQSLEGRDRLRIFHTPNGRMSAARNVGIENAAGELIVALDADDHFEKSFFEKALKVLNSNQNVAVVSSYIQHFGLDKKVFKPRGGTIKNFLFSNQCAMCSMFRKTVWVEAGKFDEEMVYGYEDWEFYIRITALGYRIHIIPEILFFYRQTKKSTLKNHTVPNAQKIITYILNKHEALYKTELNDLMINKQVLYTESRISWQQIIKMILARITGKYK